MVWASALGLVACGGDGQFETGFPSAADGTTTTTETGMAGGEAGESEGASGDGDGDGDGDPGDGDGDGDGDPGDGDGEPGEPVPCEIPEIEIEAVVPHVMLVLDKSGSMIKNTWDHDANVVTPNITRWKSLHSVVILIVNNFDDEFEFGAQLFPSSAATNDNNQNACLLNDPPEVWIAPDNAVDVLLGIPTGNSLNIRGGTPTAAGMTSAIDHLINFDDGDPAAIILITDGAANCRTDAINNFDRFEVYDPNLLGIVGDAFIDLEIPTYVVGIDTPDVISGVTGVNGWPADGFPDGISTHQKLNELAVAGGKPLGGMTDYYQTQNEIELQAALQTIVDDAQGCTATLDPVPPEPDLVEVVMDGENVPKILDCETENGWTYTNPNGPYNTLELCGTWCDMLSEAELIKAEYFCNAN